MARNTNYQKLSLVLDAENQKLKEKLAQTKKQLGDLKSGTDKVQKGFRDSLSEAPGMLGDISGRVGDLTGMIAGLNPVVLGMGAAVGMGALAWKDMTAYTKEWDGAISDAGRSLTAFTNGFKTFMEEASEARGKALAEGGLWGWLKEGVDQILGIATGKTGAMLGVFAGAEDVINSLYITWQQGLLDTLVPMEKLEARQTELYNLIRSEATSAEDRAWYMDEYRKTAEDIRNIKQDDLNAELAYLLKIKDVRGAEYTDLMRIEQINADLAKADKGYHEDLTRLLREENKLTRQKNNALKEGIEYTKYNFGSDLAKPEATSDILFREGNPVLAIAEQFQIADEIVEEFTGETMREKLIGSAEAAVGVFYELGDALVNTMFAGKDAVMSFAETMKQWAINLLRQLAAVLIKAVAVAAVLSALGLTSISFGGILKNVITGAQTVGQMIGDAPSYAVGTDYVPQTGLAMVHKGEAIIPASQNRGNNLVAVVKGSDLHFIMTEYDRKRNNTL